MMRNKKGQTLGIAIMVALFLFIVGMMSVNFLKDEVSRARDGDNLDCSNTNVISDGNKLTCLAVDIVIPYFIITVISVSGGYITRRFILGRK